MVLMLSHCWSLHFVNSVGPHHSEWSSWPDFNLAPRLHLLQMTLSKHIQLLFQARQMKLYRLREEFDTFYYANQFNFYIWFTQIIIPVKSMSISDLLLLSLRPNAFLKHSCFLYSLFQSQTFLNLIHTEFNAVVLRSILKKALQ